MAEYKISGKLNLSDSWQQQIFLVTIDKLDDYYKSDPSFIINVGPIDQHGNFSLTGDNLPNEKRFYRLYLIKEENSEFDACLYVGGDDHNFIHLILDNQSEIQIDADEEYLSPFGNYSILQSDQENILMRELNRLVHPSYYFYQIKFPSELQFSQDKLNRDLLNYADTCSNSLVGLAAIINTDLDNYYVEQKSFYRSFGQKLKDQFPKHSYTNDYYRKLRYYDPEANQKGAWMKYILVLLGISTLVLLYQNLKLKRQLNQSHLSGSKEPKLDASKFTKQELKILELIIAGNSNKEIAAGLFVELSTVKTHINKLYSKLGVSNRAEAIKKGKGLQLHKSI